MQFQELQENSSAQSQELKDDLQHDISQAAFGSNGSDSKPLSSLIIIIIIIIAA